MSTGSVPPSTFRLSVATLAEKQARLHPDRVALIDGSSSWSFRELDERANRWARLFVRHGVVRGERVALLSENRHEYLELELAAAKVGAIVACLNWRLADEEMLHCVTLTAPAAVISHRAMLARMVIFTSVVGAVESDAFLAWAPLFHMVSTDHALITLMLGGPVICSDGLDLDVLTDTLRRYQLNWLVAMPGMIERMIEHLRRRRPQIRGVRAVGAMADLVPGHQLRELTQLLGAPYLNTFGSTEAGLAPASADKLAVGVTPNPLSKRESPYCEIRLVATGADDTGPTRDADRSDDVDVPVGTPGELLIRGPSLFSGYWNAEQTNRANFRGGWFHTGDLFVRHADGTLDFVDRVKYLIKTGGENVYPAEIERHLLAHPGVLDAVVVRRRGSRWGEVPVGFVALADPAVSAPALLADLRTRLSSYKLPKEIHVISESEFPRSTTGKIQRHEVEVRFAELLDAGGR